MRKEPAPLLHFMTMAETRSNIVLIGMPGAGKSTVGIILARIMAKDFIDTDVLIQLSESRPLQDIVDNEGHMALRKIEEDVILKLGCRDHIIATGGSAVYSKAAMDHLGRIGDIVFLDADLPALDARVRDFDTRGLAKRADQTFADLFRERRPLYKKYARITVECSGHTQEEVCAMIIEKLPK
jgi:shikimate kinase